MFARLLPAAFPSRLAFWATLPFSLLLLSVGVATLKAAPFTSFLPFLSLAGGLCCWRYRTTGLVIAYGALAALLLAFYKAIPPDERLWQMGILFSLALDFYLTLLGAEEIEAELGKNQEETHQLEKHLHQTELTHVQCSQKMQEDREALEQEIRELKEEAEQRRIERQQLQKQFQLVESEIEMLTSQKNQFIDATRQAQTALAELKDDYENLLPKTPLPQRQDEERINDLKQTLATLTEERDRWQKEVATLQEQLAEPQNIPSISEEEINEWKRAKAQAEGLYKQLRIQFEEKSQTLSEARKEIFQLRGELEAHAHQQRLDAHAPPSDALTHLERNLETLSTYTSDLEEEISHLESLITTLVG